MDKLFEAEALDVFIVPAQMKKNRPGQVLNVLCKPENEQQISGIIFSSGMTLGIRKAELERSILPRQNIDVDSEYGNISVKLAIYGDKTLYFPEYEDVVKAARKTGKNFDEIYFEILKQIRKE